MSNEKLKAHIEDMIRYTDKHTETSEKERDRLKHQYELAQLKYEMFYMKRDELETILGMLEEE